MIGADQSWLQIVNVAVAVVAYGPKFTVGGTLHHCLQRIHGFQMIPMSPMLMARAKSIGSSIWPPKTDTRFEFVPMKRSPVFAKSIGVPPGKPANVPRTAPSRYTVPCGGNLVPGSVCCTETATLCHSLGVTTGADVKIGGEVPRAAAWEHDAAVVDRQRPALQYGRARSALVEHVVRAGDGVEQEARGDREVLPATEAERRRVRHPHVVALLAEAQALVHRDRHDERRVADDLAGVAARGIVHDPATCLVERQPSPPFGIFAHGGCCTSHGRQLPNSWPVVTLPFTTTVAAARGHRLVPARSAQLAQRVVPFGRPTGWKLPFACV